MNDRRTLGGIIVVTKAGLRRREIVPARPSEGASAAGAVSRLSEAGVAGRNSTLPRFTAVAASSATTTDVTPKVEAVCDLRCCWFLRNENSPRDWLKRTCTATLARSIVAERRPLS